MAMPTSLSATHQDELDGLLYGRVWSGDLSFGFPDSIADYEPDYAGAEPHDGFAPVSAATQAVVRAALLGTPGTATRVLQGLGVAQLTALPIAEAGTEPADLRVAQSNAPTTSYGYYPGPGTGGDVWFGTVYDYRNPLLGNYAYLTTLHELGHALGLKHAQETGGVANLAVPADRDGLEFTVMSYRSYIGGPASYSFGPWDAPQSYMMLDIAALQAMYGANYATRAGDDTYRWSPATGEMFIDGIGQGMPGGNRIFLTLWDGGGHDTFDLSNYGNGVQVSLAAGGWSVLDPAQLARLGEAQLAAGNVFNAMLHQGDTRSLIEDVIGGAGNDTIGGNELGNRLWGGEGNDSLSGLAGSDTLEGGAGADTLDGGAGNDTLDGGAGPDLLLGGPGDDLYLVTAAEDLVTEAANGGSDTIQSGASFTLPDHVEALTLTGTGDLSGIGNALGNRIAGNAGNDLLDGGGGNDTLAGGAGDDTYVVDSSGDRLVERSDAGTDLVRSAVSWTLGANFENLVLTGSAGLLGAGNAQDNVIIGNAGGNLLLGGEGSDTLLGGDGLDTLAGGAGQDAFRFAAADAGADLILDFNTAEDRFEFSVAGFAGLAAGMSLAGRLVIAAGAAASGALGQILFDTASATLSWDADGGGNGAAVLLATLYAPLGAVSTADFVVIA
ncbi:hypothetical protein JYK14_23385 [Siccirubricoccus sp. KC 17139]|uniref:Peptidase metallopeptidase domain-containing protein n=1 Tax=Siccirubricoccus soli TaxID=2899147 RepID=A0ABT1DAW4_9PROT|nr:M10 family metallopeptidase [Siccirubricoccus soli]MCO6419079.1 hypothetical protein [Siccirubricoccus soli]MCP2685214.1 hypothetical protein [Siccirubricoccus soli]